MNRLPGRRSAAIVTLTLLAAGALLVGKLLTDPTSATAFPAPNRLPETSAGSDAGPALGPPAANTAGTTAPPATAQSAPVQAAPSEAPPAPWSAFDAWTERWLAAPDSSARALLLPEGVRLARTRREAMFGMIRHDPARALAATIPFALRQQLPDTITDLLEHRISGRGDLEIVFARPPVGQENTCSESVIRTVTMPGQFYYAYTYGHRARLTLPALDTPILGIAIDDRLALSDKPYRPLEPAEAAALSATPPADPCPVCGRELTGATPVRAGLDLGGTYVLLHSADEVPAFFQTPSGQTIWAAGGFGGTGVPSPIVPPTTSQGDKKFLFMRVRFADDAPNYHPETDSQARSDLETVIDRYAEMSYGTLQGSYGFTPTMTLPKPRSGYMNGWSDVDGMYALLDDAKILASHLEEPAGSGLYPYHPDEYDLYAVRWNGEPGGCCSYGGGGNAWIRWDGASVLIHEWGHAIGLPHSNWWAPETDDPLGPGQHEEYGNPFDNMGSGGTDEDYSAMHKALIHWIPTANLWSVTSNGTYRIFAHDQPSILASNRYALSVFRPSLEENQLWIEYRPYTVSDANALAWSNGIVVSRHIGWELLDSTPQSAGGKNDCPLVLGRTFNDTAGGIYITPLARGAKSQPYVDVAVRLENGQPNHPPVCLAKAATNAVALNTAVLLTVTALDPDGDTLAYAWEFGDGTFSVNNAPVQSKRWTATGTYVVRCTVSDLRGGIAAQSFIVKVGAPTDFLLGGRVLGLDGKPLPGVQLQDSGGRLASSDTDGCYWFGRTAAGTYSVTARHNRYAFSPTTLSARVGPSATSLDFRAASEPGPGLGIRQEYWTGLDTANTLPSLTNSTRFPNSPSGTHHLAEFFEGVQDWQDAYGTRTRGFFIPPQDGGYVFWIASDDASELWLGRDENPATRQRIGFVTSYTDSRAWTKLTAQKSALLQLVAGRRYYIEALHKEGAGGDHLAVGVTLPDGTQERPIPFHRLMPFTAPDAPITQVSLAASSPWVLEGGAPIDLVFTRTGSVDEPLEVYYQVGGTATPTVDFTSPGLKTTIPAGTATGIVSVFGISDALADSDETILVTLAAGAKYTLGTPSAATLTLSDTTGAIVLNVLAPDPTAAKATGDPARFRVVRTGDARQPLLVNCSLGGTAQPGLDYADIPSQLRFEPGASSLDVPVIPTPAIEFEPPSTVVLALASGPGYAIGTSASATVTLIQPGPGLGIQRDWWTGIGGSALSDLTNNPAFPGSPSGTEVLTGFFETPRDFADDYGSRVRGWFVAPMTGAFYFFIASDDASRLFLSTDDTEARKRSIAYVTGYTDFRNWTANSSQRSGPVSLAAGRRYYIEAIHKEGGGGDHLSVGVQWPNGMLDRPISAQWLDPWTPAAAQVVVTAADPTASESGDPGVLRFQRTGDRTDALAVQLSLAGTAQSGTDYALEPTLGAAPFWLRLARAADRISGYASPDGTNWALLGTNTFPGLPASGYLGVAVCSSNTSLLNTSVFDRVALSFPNTGWTSLDIGAVGRAGSLTVSNDALVVAGAGQAVWGAADACHFAYQRIDGDGEIVVRVSSQDRSAVWAKAGLMWRETLGANARNAFVAVTPANQAMFQRRSTAGSTTTGAATPVLVFPPGSSTVAITVHPIPDTAPEGVEDVTVTLRPGAGYEPGPSSAATVSIVAAPPFATVTSTDAVASEEGTDPAVFRFALSSPAYSPVALRFAVEGTATPASDYLDLSDSVTIPAQQSAALVTVSPMADLRVEGDETVSLRLLPGPGYLVGAAADATAIVRDSTPTNTPPILSLAAASGPQITLRITGNAGLTYTILSSTNLVDWTPVFATNNPAPEFLWTEPDLTAFPQRFYRVRLGP